MNTLTHIELYQRHVGFAYGLGYALAQMTEEPYYDFDIYEEWFDPKLFESALRHINEEAVVFDFKVMRTHEPPMEGITIRFATTENPKSLPDNWETRP